MERTGTGLLEAKRATPKAVVGLLLDVDDTLVDTRGAFKHALGTVAASYLPASADAEAMTAHWRADASGWYRAHARGELSHREQRMRRANELHAAFGGEPLSEAGYDAWDAVFEAAFKEGWRAHDDAVAFLDHLDALGIDYGAVTNADTRYQETKLARVGLGRVQVLVGVDRFGVGKPDPRVFREGARLLGLAPALVAYVGDEKDIDAAAAVEAGLAMGIWLDRPGGHPQPGALGERMERVDALARVAEVLALTS